jgi:hypothetical protein
VALFASRSELCLELRLGRRGELQLGPRVCQSRLELARIALELGVLAARGMMDGS